MRTTLPGDTIEGYTPRTYYIKGSDDVANEYRNLYGPYSGEVPGMPSQLNTMLPGQAKATEEAVVTITKEVVDNTAPGKFKTAVDVATTIDKVGQDAINSGSLPVAVGKEIKGQIEDKVSEDINDALGGNSVTQAMIKKALEELQNLVDANAQTMANQFLKSYQPPQSSPGADGMYGDTSQPYQD